MALILNRNEVLKVYADASERGWVLPAFNAENQTTCEAILSGASEFGELIDINNLPIILAITNNYAHRPQSHFYTHTGQWKLGMRLFLDDVHRLTAPDSPFADLQVMIHLDHICWDRDEELLNWDMDQFSSIMFDASDLPFDMNIRKTAEFVKLNREKIVIEGACDEIRSSSKDDGAELTTPEMAAGFYKQTGVDILVANLGTEHRASAATLKYHGEQARAITRRIGARLCLHGTSSIPKDRLSRLFEDGIRKVNIWTSLERDSVPDLFQEMLLNASKVMGPEKVKELLDYRMLGENVDRSSIPSVDYFTTAYRQGIIFKRMQEIVMDYLRIWYK